MDKSTRLPNAIVIGAPRSGTTSLFFYLKQHPDVFLPVRKELHYFSYDLLKQNANGPGYQNVLENLCATKEMYLSHYAEVSSEKVIAEVSPSYLYYADEVSQRILTEIGPVKIIALLRNPMEKAFSQYMHLVRLNLEHLDFYEALMTEAERRQLGWGDIWYYAESSLYVRRIKRYISTFGQDRVKIVLLDDLAQTPDQAMQSLFKFLEVDASFQPDTSIVYNRSGVPKSKLLANFFGRQNFLKTAMTTLIPERIRVPIRLAILNMNSGQKAQMEKRAQTYLSTYFHDDILELEGIIKRQTGWVQS